MRNYARSIKLTNASGRDAEVAAVNVGTSRKVQWVDEAGRPVRNVKFLKSSLRRDLDVADVTAEDLIKGDPEIDLETCGTILDKTSKVYASGGRVAHRVVESEIVRGPDGQERDRRPRQIAEANAGVEAPLRWSGKLIRREEACRRFVFSRKQQLVHINGLTYDFLYGMARELESKDSLLLLGVGKRGTDPLVFQRGGKAYRGFLEGRTRGDRYCLVLHLSNMELKGVSHER